MSIKIIEIIGKHSFPMISTYNRQCSVLRQVRGPMREDKRKLAQPTLEALRHTIIQHFSDALYHEVGIRDICQQAKVSPKTVYKYFGSKQELLLACIETDLNELTDNATQLMERESQHLMRLRALVLAQLTFYANNPTVARIVFLNLPAAYWVNQQSAAQTRFQTISLQALIEAQRCGVIAPHIKPQMVQDLSAGAVNRLITRWLLDGCENDLLAMGTEAMQALEQGWYVGARDVAS